MEYGVKTHLNLFERLQKSFLQIFNFENSILLGGLKSHLDFFIFCTFSTLKLVFGEVAEIFIWNYFND